MTKVAIVGAGSLVFTRKVVNDLLQQEVTADAEVHLVDIDAHRLERAQQAVERLGARVGRKFPVVAAQDCATGVRGCDYVVNAIQVGGKEATLVDFDIPEKFGVRQTIADTHGIGGISRALRTIPPVLEIAQAVAENAPDAWFLNYTNPMAMVVMALARASGTRHVGLCHGTEHTVSTLAGYLGTDRAGLAWQAAGINHMTWNPVTFGRRTRPVPPVARVCPQRRPRQPRGRRQARAAPQVRLFPERVERAQRRVLLLVPAP